MSDQILQNLMQNLSNRSSSIEETGLKAIQSAGALSHVPAFTSANDNQTRLLTRVLNLLENWNTTSYIIEELEQITLQLNLLEVEHLVRPKLFSRINKITEKAFRTHTYSKTVYQKLFDLTTTLKSQIDASEQEIPEYSDWEFEELQNSAILFCDWEDVLQQESRI